ncbi:hypothetical protein HMPREF1870_01531 [Bacteroidales bacterium KA00344]|nr:hypothetical protein HMPREF1870_01531 [Bacteroidales bacterium KA00344]
MRRSTAFPAVPHLPLPIIATWLVSFAELQSSNVGCACLFRSQVWKNYNR